MLPALTPTQTMSGSDGRTVATAFCAVVVAFLSASQDVVLDALRIELLEERQQGAGAAVYVMGYAFGRFWIERLRIDPANGSRWGFKLLLGSRSANIAPAKRPASCLRPSSSKRA